MKRVLFSVAGTVLGLVGLLSFKSHGSALTGAGGLATGSGPTVPTHAPPPHTSSSGAGPGAGRPRIRHHPAPGSRSSAAGTQTVLGSAVQTPYGVVQVRVTVAGSRIQKVSLAQLTAFDGTSQQINSFAAPILVRQTLHAQSAHIDGVSGASYTSAGYVRSLQSALDRVGLH